MGRQQVYCMFVHEDCGLKVTAYCPGLMRSGRVSDRLVKKLPPVDGSVVPSETVDVTGRFEIVVPVPPLLVQTSTTTSTAFTVVVGPRRAVSMRVRLNAAVVENA